MIIVTFELAGALEHTLHASGVRGQYIK